MDTQQITSRVIKTAPIKWRLLQFIQQEDFKQWVSGGDKKLQESLLRYQFIDPFKVWESGGVIYCLDGYHRYDDLESLAAGGTAVPDELPATFIDCRDKKEAAELVLIYSSRYAQITKQGLSDFVDTYGLSLDEMQMTVDLPGFDDSTFGPPLNIPIGATVDQEEIARSLQERFIVPPFSVLDTRMGYWQNRKKQWHSLGINSQATREDVELIAASGQGTAVYDLRNKMREELRREPDWQEIIAEAKAKGMHLYEGASIFDPVLAELVYKWFCPDHAFILDPFAGGSVRGIVAGVLGYKYIGIDLRADQVTANEKQRDGIDLKCQPIWINGDSGKVLRNEAKDLEVDFLFSCPPYHDLEKYSDDPEDLSNMSYPDFLSVYRDIIFHSVNRVKDNRFACFVVSDIRDKDGYYRNFVSNTIEAFQDAGMQLYNEIILVNVAGSLPIRVGRQFAKYRKVGKMHQNVLVFYKGDVKQLPVDFPEIEVDQLTEAANVPEGVEQL